MTQRATMYCQKCGTTHHEGNCAVRAPYGVRTPEVEIPAIREIVMPGPFGGDMITRQIPSLVNARGLKPEF
jgi:hypothetical protein